MKKIIILVIAAVLVGLGVFWLFSEYKMEASKYKGPVEKISLRLKWIHQAQFAGNYVAADKGYYADQGLDVDLQPIDLKDNTIDAVAAGRVDFGISSADDVILARAKGKKIKAIAVIYKVNPTAVISLADDGVLTPEGLVGKRVGIQEGNPTEYLFDAMLEIKGINKNEVKKTVIGYDASELLSDKIDAIVGYITNEPDMVIQAGKKPVSILLADYGVSVYADVLFTSDELIENNPEMVGRFVKATLSGWQYAIENDEEAVDITLKYAKGSLRSHEEYMLSTSTPLINTGTSRLGMMNAADWVNMQDLLYKHKLLTKKINIEDAYTMQFLNEIYKK